MVTEGRLSTDVKTGLCEALKWHFHEGHFIVKVPASPGAKVLKDWLWKQREPMAQYTDAKGAVVAWQWRLTYAQHRKIWTAKGPRLE